MNLAKGLALPVTFLLGILTLIWWKDHRKPADGESPIQTEATEASGPGSGSQRLATEGRWLEEEVARDIAEMVLFACDPKADPGKVLKLTVKSKQKGTTHEITASGPKGDVSNTVELKHHAWSPADHAAWATALLKAWRPAKSSGEAPDGGALTRNLTDPTTATIIREERRLSGLLNKQPLHPELHEQAALVVGAFALREAAGNNFTDVRPALCRMTAHLALARALRAEAGVCGQLAEAVQLTLAMRQTEALERIAKFPVGLEAWATALKMRNTGDWRMCEEPGKATLLEQTCWARAVSTAVDANPLQIFLEKYDPADVPDWHRAVFGRGFSVEHGHVFATDSMAREFTDISLAWKTWSGKDMKKDDLVMLLNAPPARAVVKASSGFEIAVLGWGQIAAQHQRHLCNAAYFTNYFLRDLWGEPDASAALERQIHSRLSGLRLYPLLVRCLMCSEAGQSIPDDVFAKAMRDAIELCKNQPQIVSTANWALLTENCGRPMPASPPPPSNWFQPSLPSGTAFDFEHRINDLHLAPDSQDLWSRSLGIAPYDFDIIDTVLESTSSNLPPLDRVREAFKNISGFHLRAMRKIANTVKRDPKAYAEALRPACALDPNLYFTLGEQLLRAGREDDAVAAYEAAFERATDRIQMSNECDWLVNYYFDHGRKDDALKVANEAAEVYSYRGLETAGRLMERMEDWEAAAGHYAAIAERYGSAGPLMGFLARNKDGDPKVAEMLEKLTEDIFPDGMKKVAMTDFKDPPRNGALITSDTESTRAWGLKSGDIIVALDGMRVESYPQYDFVRAMQPPSTPLGLIVWDGTQYREMAASVPDRRFGCGMDSYRR